MEDALDFGNRAHRERESPQLGLFDMGETTQKVNAPTLPTAPEWDDRQILALEKETLGFYISGHPLGRFEEVLERFAKGNALALKEMDDGSAVRIGGIITAVKTIRTKKGDPMAFVTVEDRFGATEAVVFTSVYQETAGLLAEDNAVLVEGKLQRDENAVKILADRIIDLEEAETQCAAAVHIHVDATRADRAMLERLRSLLGGHRGDCRGFLHIRLPGAAETVIAMPESMPLAPGEALRREVEGLLGRGCVDVACKAPEYRESSNGRGKYGRASG
jgi:DNA polymerase-3 subunit alpha